MPLLYGKEKDFVRLYYAGAKADHESSLRKRSLIMEFHENRPVRPFYGFVLLARIIRSAWRRHQTRRLLSRLDDEKLRDIGLRRDDIDLH